MKQSVYYRNKDEFSEIAITEDGKLEHYYRLKDGFLTGSVYVGKIRSIKKHIGIFVDIGLEKDGLLTYREGLKPGDCITVMVTKEPSKKKGCALTERITLAGRFVVLNDAGEYKFSSKLSEECKVKLFGMGIENIECGFIFRSACMYAELDEIKNECTILFQKYIEITKAAQNVTNVKKIFADDAFSVAKRYAYNDENLSLDFSKVEKQVSVIGQRTVVCDGVELVFDKTEAMTVVDVNMHKYVSNNADPDLIALNANKIAVKELASQIRLRNIGGIIMVDFISLKNREYIDRLKTELINELAKDNVRTNVELVESIGMFAIIRKKRFDSI